MKRFLLLVFSPTWRKLSLLVASLFLTAMYVYIFPAPTLSYIGAVLAHLALGIVAVLFLMSKLREIFTPGSLKRNSGWIMIVVGAAVGVVLMFIGTSRPRWN